MKETDIIEQLRSKLAFPTGRHLYGILGNYGDLQSFAAKLQEARIQDGQSSFPAPISVNQAILDTIPDEEFQNLVKDEARFPEPTATQVRRAFEAFLQQRLKQDGLLVLAELELLFAYNLELSNLRTLATDGQRIILLLPGKREGGRIILFPEISDGRSADCEGSEYTLPSQLVAENHLWELK